MSGILEKRNHKAAFVKEATMNRRYREMAGKRLIGMGEGESRKMREGENDETEKESSALKSK